MVRQTEAVALQNVETQVARTTLRRFTGIKRKMFSVKDQEIVIQMYYGVKNPTEEQMRHPIID